jgi:hypothetical protein
MKVMKVMKVIHNWKNRTNKEFQHSMESKLIEVMKMKIAQDSIRVNREFDSNESDESDESDSQLEKQDEQRISTFDGIKID